MLEWMGGFDSHLQMHQTTFKHFDSEPGVVRVGGRHFAVISYDGANVKMYMNGHLHKSFAQTGAPHSST